MGKDFKRTRSGKLFSRVGVEPCGSLDKLPTPVLRHISSCLDLRDICVALTVNRRWQDVLPLSMCVHARTRHGTDTWLQNLSSLPGLRSLDLSPHRDYERQRPGGMSLQPCRTITDVGVQHLSVLTELRSLDLGFCIEIRSLTCVSSLRNLETLSLFGCNWLTDTDMMQLTSLTRLRHLDLGKCQRVTGAGLRNLTSLTRLTNINLLGCNAVGSIDFLQCQRGWTRSTQARIAQEKSTY